jgi:hypothetical protein
MNQEELDELRAIVKAQPISTHYESCWKDHGWCAVTRLLDDWESTND